MNTEVQDIIKRLEAECAEAGAEAEEGIAGICNQLSELGVDDVHIEFYGSGDIGSIEDIEFTPPLETPNPALRNEIEEWADKVIEGTGVDWYNNEGGYGNIFLDIQNREYSFEVYQNHQESTLEASDTVSI